MRIGYIDGGALEAEVAKLARLLGEENLEFDFIRFISEFGFERTFYYDAWPTKKSSESDIEFDIRKQKKADFFAELNRAPNVHVRTGTTRWDRKERTKQKAVDVLLATDALAHALNGVSNQACFLLSDLDFYPVFEQLTHTRVRTFLIYWKGVTNSDLIEAADAAMAISDWRLLSCLSPSQVEQYRPMPPNGQHFPMTDEEQARAVFGKINELECAVWREDDGRYTCFYQNSRVSSPKKELCLAYWTQGGSESFKIDLERLS